jgi:RNA polymerase sigma factor (sigma-70 family)
VKTLDDVVNLAARRYAARCWWADVNDLRQEAWVAVLDAQRTFDPTRGVPLHGYAWRAAVNALRTYTWRAGSPVYAPIKKLDQLAGLTRDELDLELPGGSEGQDDRLHDSRASTDLESRVRHLLNRGRYGMAVQLTLLDGVPPREVALLCGVPVTHIWEANNAAKRRLRADPTLRRLMMHKA